MSRNASNSTGSARNRDDDASTGIPGLPERWRVPVQLISTFGLAVFLVLYYLFVIRPEDNARFETMRQSIDELKQVVRADKAVVTDEQAERLERLYIAAVAPDVANILQRDLSQDAKGDEVERVLLVWTDELRGFLRESGRSVAEQLQNRLRPANPDDPDVASILVRAAADNNLDPSDRESIENALDSVLRPRAMAK